MENLFTPWRYAYLSGGRRERGCIFCRARDSRDDASHLVVHRARHNFVILNRYPYNNGHLMIVPYAHLSELSDGTPGQLREMMLLASRCEKVLKEAYRMDGMNLGITNILVMGPWSHGGWGRGDGDKLGDINFRAKTSEYYREKIELPFFRRFLKGDTNFVTVVGGIRVTPESLEETYRKLASRLASGKIARATRGGRERRS